MMDLPEVSAADLAALLASKLCHDIISPVGAVQSGLELLDEMPNDPESMALVRNSTKSAVAKLQFLRMAFGASGSSAAQIDLGDARTVAEGLMGFERATLTWSGERAYVAKNVAKLVLNLVVVASASVPRGREVAVEIERLEPSPRITVTATGVPLRVPQRFRQLLAGEGRDEAIDAHGVQPYYTLLLARELGLDVTLELNEGSAVFHVAAPAPAMPEPVPEVAVPELAMSDVVVVDETASATGKA